MCASVACGQPGADDAPVFPALAAVETADTPDLAVWPADGELRALVEVVAPRIERATGLVVQVTDDTTAGPPLFWATRRADDGTGWLGITHVDAAQRTEWLAIDPLGPRALHETVVLHEVLHALGVSDHVGTGVGVMSPEIWDAFPITEADLHLVCAVRDCSVFEPEGVML